MREQLGFWIFISPATRPRNDLHHIGALIMKPTRLAVAVTHPIQYYAPLLRELALRPGVHLKVFYCSDAGLASKFDPGFGRSVKWDTPLLEGYEFEFLASRTAVIDQSGFRKYDCPAILERLTCRDYDVVLALTGYAHRYGWQVRAAARNAVLPFLVRPEASPHTSPPSRFRHLVRNTVARAYYRGCAAVLTIGKRAETFLRRLGVPEHRLFASPYAVDNKYFQSRARELMPQREAIRQVLGISNARLVLVFVGKLQHKKQPLFLAEALRRLGAKGMALIVVGDGELREPLRAALRYVPDLQVHFAGFQNQSEIPRYYSAADCLVLPSTYGETWGLVVNEAMNFGCVPLVSDLVGCADDLVLPDRGFIFSHGAPSTLTEVLSRLLMQPELLETSRRRALCTISTYSIESAVDGIVRALRAVTSAKS